MRNKILIIFIIAFLISILIYFRTKNNDKKILIIGDNEIINNKIPKNIQKYQFNNITYKEIINKIKYNDKIIIKNKKYYINQLISKADLIILNANNNEYFNKCKKNNIILNNYDHILEYNINDLIKIINKISKAKIIVVGNYCKNKNYNQILKINSYYLSYNDYITNFNALNYKYLDFLYKSMYNTK